MITEKQLDDWFKVITFGLLRLLVFITMCYCGVVVLNYIWIKFKMLAW